MSVRRGSYFGAVKTESTMGDRRQRNRRFMRATKSSRSRDLIASSNKAAHNERVDEMRAKGMFMSYDDEVWLNRRQAIKQIRLLIGANAELEKTMKALHEEISDYEKKCNTLRTKTLPKAQTWKKRALSTRDKGIEKIESEYKSETEGVNLTNKAIADAQKNHESSMAGLAQDLADSAKNLKAEITEKQKILNEHLAENARIHAELKDDILQAEHEQVLAERFALKTRCELADAEESLKLLGGLELHYAVQNQLASQADEIDRLHSMITNMHIENKLAQEKTSAAIEQKKAMEEKLAIFLANENKPTFTI